MLNRDLSPAFAVDLLPATFHADRSSPEYKRLESLEDLEVCNTTLLARVLSEAMDAEYRNDTDDDVQRALVEIHKAAVKAAASAARCFAEQTFGNNYAASSLHKSVRMIEDALEIVRGVMVRAEQECNP